MHLLGYTKVSICIMNVVENNSSFRFSYVQGMNVMFGMFLYVMPELDSFYSASLFISNHCPLYVQPSLEGVHCGSKVLLY